VLKGRKTCAWALAALKASAHNAPERSEHLTSKASSRPTVEQIPERAVIVAVLWRVACRLWFRPVSA
jgi:hypothetical protein